MKINTSRMRINQRKPMTHTPLYFLTLCLLLIGCGSDHGPHKQPYTTFSATATVDTTVPGVVTATTTTLSNDGGNPGNVRLHVGVTAPDGSYSETITTYPIAAHGSIVVVSASNIAGGKAKLLLMWDNYPDYLEGYQSQGGYLYGSNFGPDLLPINRG
jgi:hypothetical protein